MKTSHVLETCLYVRDLSRAKKFYSQVLGLQPFAEVAGRHVFFKCGESMVLLFDPEVTSKESPGPEPPPHGAVGPGHCCFAMKLTEVSDWRAHLKAHGVPIEKEVEWPNGGLSLYFRDPDGNSLELATPVVWGFSV